MRFGKQKFLFSLGLFSLPFIFAISLINNPNFSSYTLKVALKITRIRTGIKIDANSWSLNPLWFSAELYNVHYQRDTFDVDIPRLKVQLSPLSLLLFQLHIYRVDIEGSSLKGSLPKEWLKSSDSDEEWKNDIPSYLGKNLKLVFNILKDKNIEVEQFNLFEARSTLSEAQFDSSDVKSQILKDGQARLEWNFRNLRVPGKVPNVTKLSGAAALLKESKKSFFLSLRRLELQLGDSDSSSVKATGRMPGLLKVAGQVNFNEVNEWTKAASLLEKYHEKSKVNGFINLDLDAHLTNKGYSAVDGYIEGEKIFYQGYKIQNLKAKIKAEKNSDLALHDIQIIFPRSRLDPSDSNDTITIKTLNIGSNKISGDADLSKVGICSLLDSLTVDECWAAFHFSGNAKFQGTLSPLLVGLEGQFKTSPTRVGSEPLKTARGEELLFLKPATLQVGADIHEKDLDIRKAVVQWSDQSKVNLSGNIVYKPALVNLDVEGQELEVAEALDSFINLHFSGKIKTNTKIFYSFAIPKEKGRTQVVSNLIVNNIAIEKQILGIASGIVRYENNELLIGPVDLKNGGGRALISGSLKKDPQYGSQMNIDINAHRIDLSGTLPGSKAPFISGLVSGSAKFQGALSKDKGGKYFGGPINAQLESVLLFGINLQKAKVQARYNDKVLYFDEILAEKDRKNVWIKGLLHPVGGSRIDFRSENILVKNLGFMPDLEKIFIDSPAKLEGFWSPKDGWQVLGQVGSGHIAHATIPAGKFVAQGQNGILDVKADFSPTLYYHLNADLGTERLHAHEMEIKAKDEGILAGMAYLKGWTAPSDILTQGNIDFRWTPDKGHLKVDSLIVQGPNGFENKFEYLVNVKTPLKTEWDSHKILQNSGWENENLPLQILGNPGDREFKIKAKLPMALFDSLVPGSQKIYSGIATLEARVPVSPFITTVQGQGQLSNVGLQLPGVGRPLTELNGNFALSNSRFVLPQGKAKLGSGNVDFKAEYLIDLKKPGVILDASLNHGQILVQDDIPMEITGDLSMRGESFPYLLSGRLQVSNGVYSREFSQPNTPSVLQKDAKNKNLINYNLDLEVLPTFEVKNSVINAPITGRLTMVGKDSTPQILGYFDLSKGLALAKDNEFQISQAHIQLPNEVGQPSQVFLRAFTNINYLNQVYRIEMNVRGPSNNLAFEFTSDPPLPNGDIINLLAFGTLRENTDSSGNKNSVETAQYEALQALFGQAIGRSINKNTGFDVRVSSSRDLSQKSTIPKVTVQRRLSKNITATFGRSLDASKPERNFQVDYKVLNNVNLTGVWESPTPEKSSTGVDLRFKFDVK